MLSARVFKILVILGTALLAVLISSSDAISSPAMEGAQVMESCFECFAPPMCAPACKAGTKCVIVPKSCYTCGSGFCADDSKGQKPPCLAKCSPASCPRCAHDEECVIVPMTCPDCSYGYCKRRSSPPDLPGECGDAPCPPCAKGKKRRHTRSLDKLPSN